MPELPEVETVRQGLNQVTLQQMIQGGDVLLDRTVAYPFSSADFLAGLRGTAITQWQRRGKYLLAELVRRGGGDAAREPRRTRGNGEVGAAGWLGVHLRMTGQLLWMHQDEPVQKHCRVRLFFPAGRELRFVDQRTFGQMWWIPPERRLEEIMTGLALLGPEPFSPEFSVAYLVEQLRGRKRPIKNALLDQGLVAGVGNIYADEALFLSGIQPQTLSASLTGNQIERLHQAVLKVLQDSIDARGTTFSDFRDVSGINGNYGGIAWVYDRKGEPCRVCGSGIERIKLAGRSAHFCPQCQRQG
ncbi:MAG: DNA-formamidopyrimidine glycosylase [Leptolyngbya sp. IPPAS B-1204]|nr:MAG: DNA-formamidopyrimidine glycosylase [Leptolyngbya sp. IPPAS B-1204]